ncbi:hypothetical protein FB107DRAFT_175007, partial [Schizophyllum commune]
HPCSKDLSTMSRTKEELTTLLNWVQRHRKCQPGYCQVLRKIPGTDQREAVCRFDYPMKLRQDAAVAFDSKNRPRFEPTRNDDILNKYNIVVILSWLANIDFTPVLS